MNCNTTHYRANSSSVPGDPTQFSLDLGWWQIVAPSILQGAGLGFVFTLLSTTALARIPREQMSNAASIYNLMRNMGASFGIAILGTLLVRRGQYHQAVLSTWSSPLYPPFQHALEGLSHALSRGGGIAADHARAAAVLYGQLRAQATMLAFADMFFVAATLAALMLIGVFLLPYTRPAEGGSAAAAAH